MLLKEASKAFYNQKHSRSKHEVLLFVADVLLAQ